MATKVMNHLKVQYATPCSVTAEQLRQTGNDMMNFDTDYGVKIVRQALAINFMLKAALRSGSVEELECIYKLTQQLSARFANEIKVVNSAMRVTYRLRCLSTDDMMGCCRVAELFHMVERAVLQKDLTLLDTVLQQADTLQKRMNALRLVTTTMPQHPTSTILRECTKEICHKSGEMQICANRHLRIFPKAFTDFLRSIANDDNLQTTVVWTWVFMIILLIVAAFVQVAVHQYYKWLQQRDCQAKVRMLTTFRVLKPLNHACALWNRALNRAPASHSSSLLTTCQQANANAKHIQNAMQFLQAKLYTSAGSFLYFASTAVARLLRSA